MNHILKTDPAAFDAVRAGLKTFEVRYNDRGYKVGDLLTLKKTYHEAAKINSWDANPFTDDEPILVEVTHAIYGPRYGIGAGWACMSIRLLSDIKAIDERKSNASD